MSEPAAVAPVYVDTSVLVAMLATDDPRHRAARRWATRRQLPLLTSVLAEVELGRALRRRRASATVEGVARRLLARCELVEVTAEIRAAAVALTPASTRSLDALHVATAMAAGVSGFATFDVRQSVAADEAGLAPIRIA